MKTGVLVDTNILIYDFMARKGNELTKNRNTLLNEYSHKALVKLDNAKYPLFIASYSIPQLVSNLQAKRTNRRAFTPSEIAKELTYILTKYTIGTFAKSHIEDTVQCLRDIQANADIDIEDKFMIHVARRLKCHYILTYNVSDFVAEANIRPFSPPMLNNLREFKDIR